MACHLELGEAKEEDHLPYLALKSCLLTRKVVTLASVYCLNEEDSVVAVVVVLPVRGKARVLNHKIFCAWKDWLQC